jgi:DNA-binding NtrC family response regulator
MSSDIIIIGTDSTVNDQISGILQIVGYEVGVCSDLDQALSTLDSTRTRLVFIDTSSVGFELGEDVDQIRSVSSEVYFILIAEYQDPLIEQEAVQHGVNNWLYRPFTAPEIILKVASCLEMASSVGDDGIPKESEKSKDRQDRAETVD